MFLGKRIKQLSKKETYRLQLPLPQPYRRGPPTTIPIDRTRARCTATPSHVHDGNEPSAGVSLKAVGGEPVVNRVEEPEIARGAGNATAPGATAGAQLKHVEGAGEEEREL